MAKIIKVLRDALKCIDVMLFYESEYQERLLIGVDVNEIWGGGVT